MGIFDPLTAGQRQQLLSDGAQDVGRGEGIYRAKHLRHLLLHLVCTADPSKPLSCGEHQDLFEGFNLIEGQPNVCRA